MAPTVNVGDAVPQGTFVHVPYTPELEQHSACGIPTKISTDAWKGKKVVLFAVPGAFTPSCHANHAPPYLAKVPELKAKGVDVVAVVSANDPFVLSGWSRILGFGDKILALSDPDAKWSSELGLDVDLSGLGIGLGKRTTRYAIVLDDLKIKYLGVEPDPTQVTVSGVDAVLAAL
ncbi:Redoxin [Polyporus arcularius HHB13444]|uniref:Putative peroxiredoxin n=1 Tax=Polyporus arcularius HHB13444 TaxID=1314778 RepID=A0A5C3P1C0_9APHY|nr:Redoxin [Polyporus arcularius HHB13444]